MLKEICSHLNGMRFDCKIPDYWYDLARIPVSNPCDFFRAQFLKILNSRGKVQKPGTEMKILQLFMQHFSSCDQTPGTILRTIALLPMISDAGFNSVMLLPHFLRSEKFRKGDRGSPYSVKDYYTIDPLLNECSDISTEDLFKAFTEACHQLGISVYLDMVPRTAARDSLWILENPEWFYWIRPDAADKLISLLQTHISGLPVPASPTPEAGRIMIEKLPVSDISALFCSSPKTADPVRWDNFVSHNRKNPDFLDELTALFRVITPPCTSDCANDCQPPWSDVTPLRLYEDYPDDFYQILGRPFLEKSAPFFLQPVLKASNFKGKKPSPGLWEKIAGVCGFYADRFNFDGVRGDMFHALPDELISMIKKNVPDDFGLVMENLNNDAGEELSKKHSFDFYTGNLFSVINEGAENFSYFIRQISKHETKILSMPVIGDSRPLFSKSADIAFFQIALCAFIPNSAYGLTADTLISNDLPVNFGLGFSAEDQELFLDRMQKKGRKIAYFNHDYLTDCWDSVNIENLSFIKNIINLRKKHFENNIWKLDDLDNPSSESVRYTLVSDSRKLTVIANFSEKSVLKIPCDGTGMIPLHNAETDQNNFILKPYGTALLI